MKLPLGLGVALMSALASSSDDNCSCGSCRKTKTMNVQLTGTALQAVQDFEALQMAHEITLAKLRQEANTAREKMWGIVKRETGTQSVEGIEIDTDYSDIGIVIMKIPVEKAVSSAEPVSSNQDGGDLEEAFRNAPDPVPAAA